MVKKCWGSFAVILVKNGDLLPVPTGKVLEFGFPNSFHKSLIKCRDCVSCLMQYSNNFCYIEDKEEKWANQGEILRGVISRICLSLSNKWMIQNGNLRTTLEKYCRFHWICKELRVEARKSISNCEIFSSYFVWNYNHNF